jgi:hypothetical protein
LACASGASPGAEFDHHPEIFEVLLRLGERFDFAANRVRFINELLRLLAIVPERLARHQRVQLTLPFLQCGDVKETSANA